MVSLAGVVLQLIASVFGLSVPPAPVTRGCLQQLKTSLNENDRCHRRNCLAAKLRLCRDDRFGRQGTLHFLRCAASFGIFSKALGTTVDLGNNEALTAVCRIRFHHVPDRAVMANLITGL